MVGGFGDWGMTYHLIDRLDNRQHLIIANLSITINIIELEGPIKLILHLSPARNAERADKLLEIDGAGFIAIEDVEDVVCEGGWVAEGEKLPVYLLELFFGEHAGGTVL